MGVARVLPADHGRRSASLWPVALMAEVWVVTGENGEHETWIDEVCATEEIAKRIVAENVAKPPRNGGPYSWEYEGYELVDA